MHKIAKISAIFGQAVKVRRHELGFSQEELAWRAGLNRTYVTDIERGARNLSLVTIEKLAQALQTPLSALLRDIDKARGKARHNHARATAEEPAQVDILLVEDNPRDRELTLHALRCARLANYIHVARDGAEALDYIFATGPHAGRRVEDRPCLVLLDLRLPRVDGLEVLRRIKSDRRTRSIPVVVLTSSDESADIAEANELGAESYIVKPVDFQRLSKVTPALNFSWTLSGTTALKRR